MRCLTCRSFDVHREEDRFIDEHAGPNDRKQFVISTVVCELGHQHKLYDAWDEALTRMRVMDRAHGAQIDVVLDIVESFSHIRRKFPFRGRRAEVAAALLGGPLDAHQVEARTGIKHNIVGSRANELIKAGWVEKLGKHTGKEAARTLIYGLTPEGREIATQWANAQDRNAA